MELNLTLPESVQKQQISFSEQGIICLRFVVFHLLEIFHLFSKITFFYLFYFFYHYIYLPVSQESDGGAIHRVTVAYAEICEGGGFGTEKTIALSVPGNGQKLQKLGLHSKTKCYAFKNILQ